ncbi:MAG: hypothetical protein GX785_15215 [Armatimonadetes bacterium]|nr:hypothetical protein [Armatimonadota bacterium]
MVQRKRVGEATEWDLIGEGAGEMFHRFCHAWSARVSPENPLPATAEEWPAIRDARRARLREAMGLTLADPCPLRPEVVAVEDRGDYTLERVLLHSRPNLVMTTHLYVPKEAPKPAPAILSVHGHWSQGKLAPRVQERNIGMAKLGFVVLCVDAIGSGERAYPGEEYHGRQLGAQALPAGLTLPGLQVWDNMRALDYLASRPEVDLSHIACTGASGGCNQTLYLAALDERVAAAAPVCCIGSLEGYLNGPHCVCELVPGIKTIGEIGDVLALIAPRPLILINGIHDTGAGFQIDDMRAQFPKLKQLYKLLGAGEKVTKCEIDLGHGYFLAMREVMYAWFRRWLMGIQADLCPEPEVQPAEPEQICCFPGGKMPEEYDTVPSLAFAEAQRLAQSYPQPEEIARNSGVRARLRARLTEALALPEESQPAVETTRAFPGDREGVVITTEPGIRVPMVIAQAKGASSCVLWLDTAGKASILSEGLPSVDGNQAIAIPDLRGLGETHWERGHTVGVWDYQYFQNGLILGRPMLGMWVWDALQCARVLRERFESVSVVGRGPLAVVALLAAALDEGIASARCESVLTSYIYPEGFSREHAMSLFVPNLLKVADVPQIASLVAPRRLHIASGVDAGAHPLSPDELSSAFDVTRQAYRHAGAEGSLVLG